MPVIRPSGLDEMLREFRELGSGAPPAALATALGAESLALVKHGFDTGTSPYGQSWKAPIFRPGGQPLRDTARLRNAWTVRTNPSLVEVENPTLYARAQNDGAVIVPVKAKALRYKVPGGVRFSRKSVLPRRQMVPDEGDLPPPWRERLELVADKVIRHYVRSGS